MGISIKVGLEDDQRNKCFMNKIIPNIEWFTNYARYNNRFGVRTLALIHGGQND